MAVPLLYHSQFNNDILRLKLKRTPRRNLDKPFIVGTSVLGAGAHGKASGRTSYLNSQEMVGALTGVFPPPMTDQAQVRAASIVHRTRIGYCQRKSHNSITQVISSPQLGK